MLIGGPQPLKEQLAYYGVPPAVLHLLDAKITPPLMEYLDLVEPPRGSSIATSPRPDGVAEVQGRPLLFFIDESKLATNSMQREKQLANLSLGLACRGD